jgi:hypothetical protein
MPIIPSLTSRLLNSAPEAGEGLNSWLIQGARECVLSGFRQHEKIYNLIANTVTAKGGEIDARAINRAINKALGSSFTGGTYEPRPSWPGADLELIEEVTADATGYSTSYRGCHRKTRINRLATSSVNSFRRMP